jgi:lysophospholipase L1-like esterase
MRSLFLFISAILTLQTTAPVVAKSHIVAKKRVFAIIGDSVASGWAVPPGYPALVGQNFGFVIHNLTSLKYPPSFTIREGLLLEVPAIPAGTTDAIVALGTDDLLSLADGSETLANVTADSRAIYAALKKRGIRTYVITVHDYTTAPGWKKGSARILKFVPQITAASKALADFELHTPGITVMDIRNYPDLIDPLNYEGDGVHLTSRGEALMAKHLGEVLNKRN